jgi:di/tricarboxylate transporter
MLGILIAMFALLIWNRLPAWVVFMLTLTVTMTLGLAPDNDLLAGFGNSAVWTVGALFIVAAGMYSTGAITIISNRLVGLPKTPQAVQLRVLPSVAAGSAFLNNTPLVAMMIPVLRDIAQAARLAASKLLIPLSFASILGGAATLIGTSTNLIIAGLVADRLGEDLNIFFPTPVGLPAAIVGIAFIIFVGTRLLPDRRPLTEQDLPQHLYKAEFVVEPTGPLVGEPLDETGFVTAEGYHLVDLQRVNGQEEALSPGVLLAANDRLTFTCEAESLPALWARMGIAPAVDPLGLKSPRYQHRLVEVAVAAISPIVGHYVHELPVRTDPYQAMVVAMSRQGRPPETPLLDVRIDAGDTAVLEVTDSFFYENRAEEDFTIVKRLRGYRVQRTERAAMATIITAAMVLLAALGVLSMLNASLLAAAGMLLTGCIGLNRAWHSVEWDTLVVLGAAIGLEAAVTASGLSQAIADVLATLGQVSPYVALVVVFLGAVTMTNVITNAAAAAFMFPIAVAMAESLGLSWEPFIAILMLGTSYAFINPAGYQTNLMVQGPGDYTFTDFSKVGLPLTILAGAVALVLAPLFYGF